MTSIDVVVVKSDFLWSLFLNCIDDNMSHFVKMHQARPRVVKKSLIQIIKHVISVWLKLAYSQIYHGNNF